MERSTQYMFGGLIALMIVVVALLSVLGRETTEFIAFIGGVIIPSVIAVLARDEAKKAKVASQQAVKNTNGRMTELIQIIQAQGGEVPPAYSEFMTPEQAAVTPVSDPSPTNWHPFTD